MTHKEFLTNYILPLVKDDGTFTIQNESYYITNDYNSLSSITKTELNDLLEKDESIYIKQIKQIFYYTSFIDEKRNNDIDVERLNYNLLQSKIKGFEPLYHFALNMIRTNKIDSFLYE